MSRVVHVASGDSAAGTLRKAGLPGEVVVSRDVFHEGPLGTGADAAFRRARARFLASCGLGDEEQIHGDIKALDQALLVPADETVLWFSHDLLCQLALLRLLLEGEVHRLTTMATSRPAFAGGGLWGTRFRAKGRSGASCRD